jgi:microcystin-dependent protein
MKRSLIVFGMTGLILSIFYITSGLSAGVPQTMNYQGTLTDNTGQPIAGTKSIRFNLYSVASGGTALWTETKSVAVTDGRFSVVLGSTTPLDAAIFTGTTFLGIKVGTDAEMAPRQKLTSVGYAFKAMEVVNLPEIPDPIPSGIIVMWSGSAAEIPQGWTLCNGNYGAPDLRDRFVIGAEGTYPVGGEGGEATHTLTVAEMPSHTHIQNPHRHAYSNGSDTTSSGYAANTNNGSPTQYTENETAINQSTGGGAAHNNLPPYYALCFIMKL